MSGRRIHIVLVGFMGSGKSTIGSLLAKELKIPLVDTDEEIVKKEKLSISSIFEQKGEDYFRRLEHAVLKSSLLSDHPSIISTGGGAPCFFDGMKEINTHGHSFYLKVGRRVLLERILGDEERPLVKNKTKSELKHFIDGSLKKREHFYYQAHKTIMAFDQPQSIVNRMLKHLDKEKI